ncbi:MAG: DUF6600 domain-containing protein, partial [Acidobacteriota bacterium]
MHSGKRILWAVLLLIPLILASPASADEIDDYIPDVTDRVARISFITGDVQIKRADTGEWEKAVLNLPIVEGDEITTEGGGRFEIQFNAVTHLRVAENSYLRITGLSDDGIALSLPQGSLTLRAVKFNIDKTFLEIDAPKTTIAVEKAGSYRIDAGRPGDTEIRVVATDGGEARVYSYNSGFSLKSGRSAKVAIEGTFAGEWNIDDASRLVDEFDTWSLDRDSVIAKRLQTAYYDKYYDQDIYGAEDLNDYGEWVHTRKYGYVWRPYGSAISQYSDWSPYRYGSWRWVGPYGWTWVNDEPWGWATYHYGRWVWDNGGWYWSPYGYYRYSRSWWQPALVVVQIVRNNVCWYPLPYDYGYYNYNHHYYSGKPRRGRGNNNHNGGNSPGGGNGNPSPSPTPVAPPGSPVRASGRLRNGQPPLMSVPPQSVVSIPSSDFGRGRVGQKA